MQIHCSHDLSFQLKLLHEMTRNSVVAHPPYLTLLGTAQGKRLCYVNLRNRKGFSTLKPVLKTKFLQLFFYYYLFIFGLNINPRVRWEMLTYLSSSRKDSPSSLSLV